MVVGGSCRPGRQADGATQDQEHDRQFRGNVLIGYCTPLPARRGTGIRPRPERPGPEIPGSPLAHPCHQVDRWGTKTDKDQGSVPTAVSAKLTRFLSLKK